MVITLLMKYHIYMRVCMFEIFASLILHLNTYNKIWKRNERIHIHNQVCSVNLLNMLPSMIGRYCT